MNEKYDPGYLLTKLALHYESVGKMRFSVDLKDLKNSYIQIANKDPKAPVFRIIKDPNRSGAAVLLVSGNRLLANNDLEKEKDNLGNVTASYEGRTPVHVDTFQKFLKWLGIE